MSPRASHLAVLAIIYLPLFGIAWRGWPQTAGLLVVLLVGAPLLLALAAMSPAAQQAWAARHPRLVRVLGIFGGGRR